jgi:DNA-binding transcriptional LysR family regulator
MIGTDMKRAKASAPAVDHPGPRTAPWSGGWATIRDLEVFKAVIECGTATRAAAQLGISQPAVSRALSQIEERSGRALFTRAGPTLAPTADGLALYEETRAIFAGLERVRALEWGARAREQQDVLRIAATPTMGQYWLNRLAARFMVANPGCRLTMEIVPTPQILEFVADRQVDLGVASVPATGSGLKRMPFRRSRYVCAMPRNHPLMRLASVKPSDLQGVPLIALVRRNDARATTDRVFTKAGVHPNIVIETSTAASAIEQVAEGAGVALVNAFPVTLLPSRAIAFKPFEPALVYDTSFFAAPDRVLGSTAQRFIEYARASLPPSDDLSEAL